MTEAVASALIGAAGTIGGAALGAGATAVNNKRSYKYSNRLAIEQQKRNEESADKALDRQLQLYDYTYDKESYAAQRKQLEEAGLNVGLMYGGGGVSGVGGQTGSAPQATGTAPQFNTNAIADPLTAAQVANIMADTKLKETQANKEGAETEQIQATTEQIRDMGYLQQWGQFLEDAWSDFEKADKDRAIYKFNDFEIEINRQSWSTRKIASQLAEAAASVKNLDSQGEKALAEIANMTIMAALKGREVNIQELEYKLKEQKLPYEIGEKMSLRDWVQFGSAVLGDVLRSIGMIQLGKRFGSVTVSESTTTTHHNWDGTNTKHTVTRSGRE